MHGKSFLRGSVYDGCGIAPGEFGEELLVRAVIDVSMDMGVRVLDAKKRVTGQGLELINADTEYWD
jgi:hypothetical protein